MSVTVKADGLKKLSDKLDPGRLRSEMANTLRDAAEMVLNTEGARNYPPSSEANTPGRFSVKTRRPTGYYLRGQGWMYPIMQRQNAGEDAATASKRAGLAKGVSRSFQVAGYKLRATSERYGTQFYTRATSGAGYVGVVMGNRASYAKWLGFKMQARIPAARGWRRLGDIIDQRRGEIMRLLATRVAGVLKK